jgi:hypothetical protein
VSRFCSLLSNIMFRGLQGVPSCESSMPRKKARLTLQKRNPRKTPEITWAVRGILDERFTDKGAKEYLCDWEPDQHGNEYDPTWVSGPRSAMLHASDHYSSRALLLTHSHDTDKGRGRWPAKPCGLEEREKAASSKGGDHDRQQAIIGIVRCIRRSTCSETRGRQQTAA